MLLLYSALSIVVQGAPLYNQTGLGVINGRTTRAGEWEGTVMVIGEDGECEGAGLCTGMFIHPEVVMTAGHCCETGATKAICTGKLRPGSKVAASVAMKKLTTGSNDFCLLHLDRPVRDVPIYEVATSVSAGDAIIVGYGVSTPGYPQEGAGTQREGLVDITSISGVDIYITGRRSGEYQNACNGDSGGPIFVTKAGNSGDLVVGGVTSRGAMFCPLNSQGTYTSAVYRDNSELIRTATREWLGVAEEVVPGICPVTFCCYSMSCPFASEQ